MGKGGNQWKTGGKAAGGRVSDIQEMVWAAGVDFSTYFWYNTAEMLTCRRYDSAVKSLSPR